MEDVTKGLREMGIPGYIRFTVRAIDNENNRRVHEAFKEFCEAECDNNYTFGIRKLLEEYEADAKFSALWEQNSILQQRITELEDKVAGLKPQPIKVKEAF